MLLFFLVVIALIVFVVSWVANMIMDMQRRHTAQVMELQRQNSQLRADAGSGLSAAKPAGSQVDLEGQPDKGKEPKLLKGSSAKG